MFSDFLVFDCIFGKGRGHHNQRHFSKVHFPKLYFCEVYQTCVSSELCEFIMMIIIFVMMIIFFDDDYLFDDDYIYNDDDDCDGRRLQCTVAASCGLSLRQLPILVKNLLKLLNLIFFGKFSIFDII